MPNITRMTAESLFTLRVIQTLVNLMIETIERDRDAARYEDLCQRLGVEIEALREKGA